MAIKPETITGRKEHFRKKRAEFVATWTTDEHGIVHIPLGDGIEAFISKKKTVIASDFMWALKPDKTGKPYVWASVIEELREIYGEFTSLHRVVSGIERGTEIDHKDGNGLNCVDSNLRPATRSQNSSNRHYVNKTGYRGVVEQKRVRRKSYSAQVEFQGKSRRFGSYRTPVEAAIRYNEEALRLFGEFALLNEIEVAA